MGVLAARGMNPDAAQGEEPQKEPEAPQTPEDGGEAPKPEQKSEFVPFSAVSNRKPGSRRERAAQEMEDIVKSQLKPLQEQWGSERSSYEERIQRQAEELAQMRGALETLQRMPAQPAMPQAKPELPDPDKLMQEAEKALDEKDIRTYHAKLTAAADAKARRIAEEQVSQVKKELEARIPQPVPMEIQYLMSRHQNVAMAGQQGVEAVMIKDKELELYRVPRGPQRLAKAFELADKFLGSVYGQNQQQNRGYSQDAAAALSSAPAARATPGGGGRQEDGATLTPLQLETIKNLGWSKEEYVKWLHPERFVKR